MQNDEKPAETSDIQGGGGELCPPLCPDSAEIERAEADGNQSPGKAANDRLREPERSTLRDAARGGKGGRLDKKARRDAVKANPEAVAAVDAIAAEKRKMPKGGRRRGSRNKSAFGVVERKFAKAIANKPQEWFDAATNQPYITTQLLRMFTPRPAPEPAQPPDNTIRVRYVDEDAHGQAQVDEDDPNFTGTDVVISYSDKPAKHGDGDAIKPRASSFSEDYGDVPAFNAAQAPTIPPAASSDNADDDALDTPAMDEAALRAATIDTLRRLAGTPGEDGELVRTMMREACAEEYRLAGDRVRQNAHIKRELEAKRQAIEREADRLNRLRMASDPACWSGGSDDSTQDFGGGFDQYRRFNR